MWPPPEITFGEYHAELRRAGKVAAVLYHRTTVRAAEAILAHGFDTQQPVWASVIPLPDTALEQHDFTDGGVWFAVYLAVPLARYVVRTRYDAALGLGSTNPADVRNHYVLSASDANSALIWVHQTTEARPDRGRRRSAPPLLRFAAKLAAFGQTCAYAQVEGVRPVITPAPGPAAPARRGSKPAHRFGADTLRCGEEPAPPSPHTDAT